MFRTLLFFSLIICAFAGNAQQTPSEIKYKAWDMHALRYYPFTQPADSFMLQVIERKHFAAGAPAAIHYEKTAIDLSMNKQALSGVINSATASQNLIYRHILLPYRNWLDYARLSHDSLNMNLTLFLSERYSKENQRIQSSIQTPFEWIGKENIRLGLERWLGEIDIWKEQNEVFFTSVKSPLAKDAANVYRYFFSSGVETDSIPTYEIAFFPRNTEAKAFEGYLYVSVSDLSPVKAVFTLNPKVKIAPAKAVLFIQTPSNKETRLFIGDELNGSLQVEQVHIRDDKSPDSIRQNTLSPAQKEIAGLVEEARQTRAYSNLQKGVSLLLTNRMGIFHDRFELGPVTQMLSYNYMEGLRLRIGGFTSEKVSQSFAFGGYLAFGTKDLRLKYHGDLIYSPDYKSRFQFTLVNDLNIPGQDCLDDKRDQIFYSLYQSYTANMSLQKIGRLSYELYGFHDFSFKFHLKYLYDQPLGAVKYETANNRAITAIHDIAAFEIGASFRFAPNEKQFYIKGKRMVFHAPDVDFRLNHRAGYKGAFGSDYDYQITDASLSKSFNFPSNTGSLGIRFSGGKIWTAVPFPLLFIPAGNQSYIFDSDDYNLMRFYEFTTDRFVAANVHIKLNWSPVKLFSSKSKLKMHGGIKALYGPLSDKNNPQLHPELFVFNNGVEALGEKPYVEANVGLSGIFKYFRIDYVYRMTYGNRGSLFLSSELNF